MPGRIPDPRNKDAAIRAALGSEPTKTHVTGASRPTGGPSGDYAQWSVDELRRRAAELDISGRSSMRKDELIAALRAR